MQEEEKETKKEKASDEGDGKKKKKKQEAEKEEEEEEEKPRKTSGFDFYKEKKGVKKMSKKEVESFRESVNLKVENCDLNPILSFDNLPVIPELLECCAKFDKPTAIQVTLLHSPSMAPPYSTSSFTLFLLSHAPPLFRPPSSLSSRSFLILL